MAATLHFETYPIRRNLFSLDVREIEGTKFSGWQQNANYSARVNVILQLEHYNISPNERQIAPNIITVEQTYSFLNIYQTWHIENVGFEEYQKQWAAFEISLEKLALELIYKLNNARNQSIFKGLGEWYINYGLNEKHIEVKEP